MFAPVAAPVGISVATEVQRLIETESFKPLALTAGAMYSSYSSCVMYIYLYVILLMRILMYIIYIYIE